MNKEEIDNFIEKCNIDDIIYIKHILKQKLNKLNITPYDEYELRNRGKCKYCGSTIGRKSKKCKSCAIKYRDNSNMSKNFKIMNGSDNPRWKGNNVGYHALHSWIRKHKDKSNYCEICNKAKPVDVANISKEYHRDINDYLWLCRKCHYAFDKKKTTDRNKYGRFKKNE